MVLPDYKKRGIVNLMSSIEKGLGGKSRYNPLSMLKPSQVKKYDNIILMIIDGMGYEFLQKHGRKTILMKNLRGKMTSVFPSTTAAALPTFITGLAPQQHAITGWFMYLKELGIVILPIHFSTRAGRKPLNHKIDTSKLYSQKTIFKRIKRKSYPLFPAEISHTLAMKITIKDTKITKYSKTSQLFSKIEKLAKQKHKKLIFAYWRTIDKMSHKYGTKSPKTKQQLKILDKKIKQLTKKIKGTNTLIIATADHGLINTPKNKRILMNNHPKLKQALTLPLCGDVRAAQCYVHPSKAKEFEKYTKTKLKKYCTMHTRKELIKKNYFGLFKPNPKLFDRTGDYTLIMKDNYLIKDFVLGEKKHIHTGNHGGTSKQEMHVPLILIDCNKTK